MASSPNLSEIATTTARNRSAKQGKGSTMPKTKTHKAHHHIKKAVHHTRKALQHHEGTPADNLEDQMNAQRHGMTLKQWEGSPQDRRQDIRTVIGKAVAHAKRTRK
jgi:hypothetical protein